MAKPAVYGNVVDITTKLDGRIAGYMLGDESYALSFDAASRVTGTSQAGNPASAGGLWL